MTLRRPCNGVIIQYLRESLALQPEVTNETEVKIAINEKVFKPLSECLHKQ